MYAWLTDSVESVIMILISQSAIDLHEQLLVHLRLLQERLMDFTQNNCRMVHPSDFTRVTSESAWLCSACFSALVAFSTSAATAQGQQIIQRKNGTVTEE